MSETDNIARGNHVVPTEWAQQLERERDEAREDAAHWKIEYEIVVSRLCGVKHDRDNGVIFEHEIIPKLQRERDEARAVADELVAIATRYLGWHLSRTPMGPDDDHLAQSRRITEAIARWKSLANA